MKKLLTLTLTVLTAVAFNASAQIQRPDGNGIIYSANPLPPIVSNNQISFAPGSPYVDRTGAVRACNTPLVVDHTYGVPHAICADKPAATNTDAGAMANLSTAAGGPVALSDRNLSSDSSLGLRNDRDVIGAQ